jgi:hypothetical protein
MREMERKVIKGNLRRKSGMDRRVLVGAKRRDAVTVGGTESDPALRKRRQLIPAKELAKALADAPSIDYEQLRADLDAAADPSPKDWYAWSARAAGLTCR